MSRDFGKEPVWQIAGRRAHLELGPARHDIDTRLERAVGAVVGDLDREIKRHPECHRRDVEDAEQRMLRQIAENVAAKETEILRAQVCQRCPENIRSRALQPEMDLSRAAEFSFKCKTLMNMESLTCPVFFSVILGTARQGRGARENLPPT